MPWLLALVGVALLAIAIEVGLRTVLWRRLETALSDAIGGSTKVGVAGSRLLGLGRGFLNVEVRSVDVPIAEGRSSVARLDVDLATVLLRPAVVVTGGGTFSATLTAEQLQRALRLPTVLRQVRVEDDHLRVVIAGGLRVDALLRVEAGSVILEPLSVVAALANLQLRWPVPPLPLGAVVEAVRCRRGAIEIAGRVPAGPIEA